MKQLGDVLVTTPAVRALSRHYPGCEIDFLTQRPADTVYANSPYIRRVICVKWKLRELLPLLLDVYRQRYDLLIDFSGSSKTAVFSWASRIPRRLGFDSEKRGWCFTDRIPEQGGDRYSAATKYGLLSMLDIDTDDLELDYYLPEDANRRFAEKARSLGLDDKPLFAVSPVSKRAYKVWPAERFAEICDRLVARYQAQIFFLIGPGESHFAEAVQAHMKQTALAIDDSLSLYEAACVLERAIGYVGNDNGLMHLSVACKRPTFGIFGRPLAVNWTSPTPIHSSIEFDPGCKSACYYPGCKLECLDGVTVEAVWDRLEGFFAKHAVI